jgi:hypothetical protein
MAGLKCISFDEIVKGRDATVRVTDDGYLYAVDLVMVVTGKDKNNSALDIRRLSDDVFSAGNFIEKQTSSRCV